MLRITIRDPNLIPETDNDSYEGAEFSGFEDKEIDDPFIDLCNNHWKCHLDLP